MLPGLFYDGLVMTYNITLNSSQTNKFWKEVCEKVDWEMCELDQYLYDRYTIVKRTWLYNQTLRLTLEDEKYITWLNLYL